MPLFEYTCGGCGETFEKLVRGGRAPTCPHCDSGDLRKLLSGFAVRGARPRAAAPSTPTPPAPCGSCGHPQGPGSCDLPN